MGRRVVIAPDSFKGSATSTEVARALADGWRAVHAGDEVVELPLADGGEGTLEALAAARTDARWSQAPVSGPDSRPVTARWLHLSDGTAVAELAQSSGLPLMGHPDPLGAHTFGLGEVLAAALDAGAQRIIVGLGGSASTDGGAGCLTALGARFLDRDGAPLALGGGPLVGLDRVDLGGVRPPPRGGVVCLTDVTSPLLGPAGAAAVFGPQKGATTADIDLLERGLSRLHSLLRGLAREGMAHGRFGSLIGTPSPAARRCLPRSQATRTSEAWSKQRHSPTGWQDKFNHYAPAQYLITHPDCVTGKASDTALDQFEHLFTQLNALL